MLPQLDHLGIVAADQVCQAAIQRWTPIPGTPPNRNQKLSDFGITDVKMLLLINSLVQRVNEQNCTLDPNTLNSLTSGSLYGEMVDLVAQAPRKVGMPPPDYYYCTRDASHQVSRYAPCPKCGAPVAKRVSSPW